MGAKRNTCKAACDIDSIKNEAKLTWMCTGALPTVVQTPARDVAVVKSSSDPFGAPPKGTSPNCGPEERYKFDTLINSKEEFVSFLKAYKGKILDQYGSNQVRLESFRKTMQSAGYDKIPSEDIDWKKVLDAVKTENVGSKLIYVLNYIPTGCMGNGNKILKMTPEGHVSVYGCCGI